MFTRASISRINLSASGLIALADLKTIAYRTALTGTASFLDVFFLAPGIHCHQSASEVNGGEYPTCGAMTTGYVFRIENQATVRYLQSSGKSGRLVTVQVSPPHEGPSHKLKPLAWLLYSFGIVTTIVVAALLGSIHDWWGLGVMSMLMIARLINITIIKRRSQIGWKGASEPGVESDLLVLLSQDRWVRMRGMVDDVKAVTAGQWLRELDTLESFGDSIATLLVYSSAALAGNVSTIGGLLLASLLLVSVALLGLCNSVTKMLRMFDRTVYVVGNSKPYDRRLTMVHELIAETKRDDWAIGLGLIVTPVGRS